MVFEPTAAPRDRKTFLIWYKQQTEWQESHDYNNPEIPARGLRNWFHEIIKTFPPMNGPLASDDPDNPKVTDYSLGRSMIYAAFAWSQAKAAYECAKELAAKHGVGFFDVSGDQEHIWWPVPGWKLFSEANGVETCPMRDEMDEGSHFPERSALVIRSTDSLGTDDDPAASFSRYFPSFSS